MAIQFFNYLHRDLEAVNRNRFAGLSRRGHKKDRTPPTEEQMILLLDACSALGDYAPMMRAMLTFAAYTLLRPSELAALDWERDVNLAAGVCGRVHVVERVYRGETDIPKGNRDKLVTLPPPAREALEQPARDPRLLAGRPGVPQQDRRPADGPDAVRLLERGPCPRPRQRRVLRRVEALRRLVPEGAQAAAERGDRGAGWLGGVNG